MVPLPIAGKAGHPGWSPDSVRIAFECAQAKQTGILDYNIQNQGMLTITTDVATSTYPDDSVLMLNWAPDSSQPALTWSVGSDGHVHSLWWKRVGIEASV